MQNAGGQDADVPLLHVEGAAVQEVDALPPLHIDQFQEKVVVEDRIAVAGVEHHRDVLNVVHGDPQAPNALAVVVGGVGGVHQQPGVQVFLVLAEGHGFRPEALLRRLQVGLAEQQFIRSQGPRG